MTYHLAPGWRLARVQGDVVLLDEAAGEYACLVGAGDLIGLAPNGALQIGDSSLAEDLMAAGAAAPGAPRGPNPPPTAPPARGALSPGPPPRLQARDLWDMAAAYLFMLRRYRGQGFAAMLAQARRDRPPRPAAASEEALARRVATFQALLPWAPWQEVCLFRAYMLLRFLRLGGLDADWVFGVRTWPFEAHCWLEAQSLVLDDSLEHMMGYAPILRV